MKWKTGQPPIRKNVLTSQSLNIFKERNFFVGEFCFINESLCFRKRNAIVLRNLQNEFFEWLDPNEEVKI